ncbi:CrcB family protein [Corynebacterium timonense]|uniref:Fluoride-specific ion channel n=1 Tax=Corynebacterium timonense TaxID=441500 RepID=A0A1H1LF59_9CORY|nr:CrcB family protein [Corynebacterium timonense]SDR72509.1 CrcB protein [Corynebacterium timonense]
MFKDAVLVGLGAALGSAVRYLLLAGAPLGGVETHLLNAAACFALGALAPGKFWGMGVFGGFSTFSAISVAAAQSSAGGAALTLALSFSTCVAAWCAGDAARSAARGRR